MTTFSTIKREYCSAPRIVELLPSMFADDWHKKPNDSMKCGIRFVSEGDIERIRAHSVARSIEVISEPCEDRIDMFNDLIMKGLVARMTCMPNDVRETFFDAPDDDVPNALTPEAIRFLCHEYDLLKVEYSNYLPEADNDDLVDLSALLLDEEAWNNLTVGKAKRLKRIAHHLLQELDPEIRE